MNPPKINHITLTTGHINTSSRVDVADATLAALRPWLDMAQRQTAALPLPVEALAAYSAQVLVDGDALVATIYASQQGDARRIKPAPLATIGVAQQAQPKLWQMLTDLHGCRGAAEPTAPWCAVALHPALMTDVAAARWLGDFERCLAWAWITDAPQLRATT